MGSPEVGKKRKTNNTQSGYQDDNEFQELWHTQSEEAYGRP